MPQIQARAIGGPDSDGDGIRNQEDLDDDNDGILDTVEQGVDSNGDGFPDSNSIDTDGDLIPDVLDLDSDNDGILDLYEALESRDRVKSLDLNPNGAIDIAFPVGSNGIADLIETAADSGQLLYPVIDTDQDGVPDFRDRDSDNDGIYDVVEAGGFDNDTDGRLDGFYDSDGKGVDDTVQASALPLFDTDGDGVLDFRDSDSDGDTIPDRIEAGSSASFPTDTDGDGAPDYRESDSDGDGTGDRQEVGADVLNPVDNNGNGIADFQENGQVGGSQPSTPSDDSLPSAPLEDNRPDRDGDGIPNQEDLDDDNDTILDSQEGIIDADGDGVADANSRDSDGDGTPDGNDLDSDNDGILDILEGRYDESFVLTLDSRLIGAVSTSIQVSANGVPDLLESAPDSGLINQPLFDTDGDGTPDFMDVDSDNDGIPDLTEAGGVDLDRNGRIDGFIDADDKGVDDAIQSASLPRFDTDNDGQPDYRDSDSDNDGIPDRVEAGIDSFNPADSDNDGAADYREQDSDNDGVKDSQEVGSDPNSPVDSNGDGLPDFQDSTVQFNNSGTPVDSGQSSNNDQDSDGQSDAIDSDDDNDGIPDDLDGNVDSDSDGIVNRLDLDSDNDGILDSKEGAGDFDNDLIPNFLDLDSDNDGVFDALEAGRVAVANSGRLSSSVAVDNQGLASGASDQLIDTDGDGVADVLDLDSDNDGLSDVVEAGFSDSNLDARIDNFVDSNSDGVDDSAAGLGNRVQDTDLDRIPDSRDLDSDQDTLSDRVENFGVDSDQDNNGIIDNFTDGNADGLDDSTAANTQIPTDTDNDGLPNSVDLDSDGDGVFDLVEAGGVDNDNDGRADLLSDEDKDGVADQNDSDSTGGDDIDNDGIDDSVDSDVAGGADTDGDGVIDSGDPDSDGNGFVGPVDNSDSPSQGDPINLPDADADGTPDFNQSPAGSIETGLDGSALGCSISTVSVDGKFDPTFAFLMLLSLAYCARRMTKRWISITAIVLSGLALTACETFDNRADRDFTPRVYGGLGALASQVEPDTDSVEGVSVADSESAGISATIGYDLNNRFSVEGHYADLGEAELSPNGELGYQVAGISGVVYGLNDSRDRSRRTGFSSFGRLGIGTLSNNATGVNYRRVNDVHMLLGLGMEYGLENGIGIRAELTAHETDAKYAQLGMIYRFGDAAPLRSRRVNTGQTTNSGSAADGTGTAILPVPGNVDRSSPQAPQGINNNEQNSNLIAATPYDTDGDGIIGDADQCPSTQPGLPVKPDGCAVFNGAIEGVTFEPGSDTLTEEAIQALSNVAETLNDYSGIKVTIEAHTDNLGDASENLQLSKRRAIAVARFLVDQGIAGTRLKPQAYGESQPRASNTTAEGRAQNRRVEFSVMQ